MPTTMEDICGMSDDEIKSRMVEAEEKLKDMFPGTGGDYLAGWAGGVCEIVMSGPVEEMPEETRRQIRACKLLAYEGLAMKREQAVRWLTRWESGVTEKAEKAIRELE